MAPKAAPKTAAAAKPAAAKAKPDAKKKEVKKESAEPRPEDLIPKVEPPDSKKFDDRADVIEKDIEKLQAKQKALTATIQEKTGGKDEYKTRKDELFAELNVWKAKIDEIKEKKDAISNQFDAQKAEGQKQKADLQKMTKAIKYSSEEDIDKRIDDINYQLHTTSVSLAEEKKLVAEIQALKKSRPQVAKVKNMQASLGSGDRGAALKEDRKALGEEMSLLIAGKQKVSEQLKALQDARGKETGGVQDIVDERNALGEKVQALIAKRKEIRAEKKASEDEYRAYQAEVRKIRAERAASEREERQKEMAQRDRVRKAEKLDTQPFNAETTLIEQTIKFCQGLVGGVKSAEVKEDEKEINHGDLAGVEVLSKKEDRADEYYFVPTASKKKGKSKGAAKSETAAAKPIKHNAETFNLFSQLKLDAPITTADVPALLEKLQGQLDEYQKKIKDWEEQREERKKKILEGAEDVEEKAEEAAEEPKAAEE